MPTLSIRDLRFSWPSQPTLLSIEHVDVSAGEVVMIHGPSGSGKTTLLSLMAGVITPQAGQIQVLGNELTSLSAAARDRFRGEHIGFVFQQFNLLPYLSVLQNVVLPAQLFSRRAERATQRSLSTIEEARRLLSELGLESGVWRQRAHTLSVGQQQRVAVARALMGSPELIIADEPTSALDEDRQCDFMRILMRQVKATNAACVMVSHQRSLGQGVDRMVEMASINPRIREVA
ncbi:MAG: ABC transporter ATP-binding protein [Burkholderiaceae bacterium]